MSIQTTPLQRTDIAPLSRIPPREFLTERLRLRAVEISDAPLIFNLYAKDPTATKYMSFKCTGKIEDTEYFVTQAALYFAGQPSSIKNFAWLIQIKDNSEYIGLCGIGPIDPTTISGGYILNQNFWSCLVEWAKTQPEVLRIEACHHPDNRASGEVMEKAGMTYEGLLPNHSVLPNISDEKVDVEVFAWLRNAP
jgi:[ribosomal protein S5]-alanine N-acetyltransferase